MVNSSCLCCFTSNQVKDIGHVPGCFPFLWHSVSLRVSLWRRIKLLLLSSCLLMKCATNIKTNSNKLFRLCLCEAFAMQTCTTGPTVSISNHLRSDCHKIWEPQPPETLRACPGLWIALLYCQYWPVLSVRLFPCDSCVNNRTKIFMFCWPCILVQA